MNETNARGLVMGLREMALAFPNREITEDTIVVYASRLAHYPTDLIVLAIEYLIQTAKWFPTISEILDAAGVGGNQTPPFVLPTGPIGHSASIRLWRARLQHGQQLRFDPDRVPVDPPQDPTERLIWLRSIKRSSYGPYHGDNGYLRWNTEVAALEQEIGTPMVKAIGRGVA